MEYLVDSSGKLSVSDVILQQKRFSKGKIEAAYFFNPYRTWIRLGVKKNSPGSQEVYLLVNDYRIEAIGLFLLRGDSIITYPETGWGIPLSERTYPHYKHIFPVKMEEGEDLTFYFVTYSKYIPFNFPVNLYSHKEITRDFLVTTLSDGLILVITLFIFIVSLFLLYDSDRKEMMYLWYSIFSLHVFLFYFLRIGIQYFNSEKLNPFVDYLAELPTVVNLVSFFFFSLGFMSTVSVSVRILKIFKTGITVLGFIAIVVYFIDDAPHSTLILLARSTLLIVWMSGIFYVVISGIRQRNSDAFLFLGMIIPLLGGYLSLIWATDISANHISNKSLWMKLIAFIEASLMMFAVFYKNGKLKKVLFQKIAHTEKQVLAAQIEVQEAERQRIASDLHDELGANIATAKRDAEELYKSDLPGSVRSIAQRLKATIATTGQDLRRITHNLMPPNFELVEAISYLVERANHKEICFEWMSFGEEKQLDRNIEINIYRMVSELVNNIQKHSGATKASIQLIYYPDMLSIQIEDNGTGFDTAIVHEGVGLHSVSARARYIGAGLRVDSGISGTSISIILPIKNGSKQEEIG